MRALALKVIVLWGWRRALLATIAGAVSVLALAPFHAFPVLLITVPLLVWMLDGIGDAGGGEASGLRTALGRLMAAAAVGWCFGFGYFLSGLYWIGSAFLVEQDTFGWLMPFAVTLMPAGLALFTALGAVFAVMFWSPGQYRVFALAAGLAGADWLRGHVLSGFPWNSFGQALGGFDVIMQAASVFGIYGLGVLTIVIAATPAVVASDEGEERSRAVPATAVILALALIGFGIWRLPPDAVATVEDVRLRIVQPNIAQKEKWRPENRGRILSDYLSMSDEATSPTTSGIGDVTHVIWPEAAAPVLFAEDGQARAAVAALLPPGTVLITGALRRESVATLQGKRTVTYNSIFAFDDEANFIAVYDKVHLVPFGEYLPMQQLLERIGLEQLTRLKGGFDAGSERSLMRLPGLPALLPLICYEIIFSGAIVEQSARPQVLLNVTNDAWFGDSSGPRQHLDQARLRAVEEGLPVIRAANTGISAVIDPYGRIVARLELNQRGVLDSELPLALPPTIFSVYGNLFFALLITACMVFALAGKMMAIRASYGGRLQSRRQA